MSFVDGFDPCDLFIEGNGRRGREEGKDALRFGNGRTAVVDADDASGEETSGREWINEAW